MAPTMKKTFYYNFFPTKDEETHASWFKRPHQVTSTLIEIRDDSPNQNTVFDPSNIVSWRIRKRLDADSASTGKILLTHVEVLEHIFRYTSLESAQNVLDGKKGYVSLYDVTDENTPIQYGPYDDHTFFAKFNDDYILVLNVALVKTRELKKDDEIGIYYDPRVQGFYFKVFR